MEKFTILRGIAAPLPLDNVSTDLLAPELVPGKTPEENPLVRMGEKLFANLRYEPSGVERPGFVLSQPRYANCVILVSGSNFGCGSSREMAVWALMEWGIRCVIAPSFGDIFYDNAFQNGLLLIRLPETEVARINTVLASAANPMMTVDLLRSSIELPDGNAVAFFVPDDRRLPLISGLDQITFILRSQSEIATFEESDQAARPWACPHG